MKASGVTLPLFSLRSERDWGIGEIPDLPAAARWLKSGGFKVLQILPPYELAAGETSPYGARTGFGIDPIYVGLGQIPDLDKDVIEKNLGRIGQAELERLRALPEVDHGAVRALKKRFLKLAFDRFVEREWTRDTERARQLRAFIDHERAWADELALYVALRHENQSHGWETWPAPERNREPAALAAARERLALRVLEHQYTQWIALGQWATARAEMERDGVMLMGDLPFVMGGESADVWAHRHLFQLGKSLGAPPDEFDPEFGQDWGLPPYDWAAMDRDELRWARARARHAARLYHAFRLDHVVGCFRQYVRPPKALGVFDPLNEKDAEAHGRRFLAALRDAAAPATIVAEDLGVIPPWVRSTLRELGLAGYRVLPWEKDMEVLRDPTKFPSLSVSTWSTHDTMPVTAWWDEFPDDEKRTWAARGEFDVNAPDHVRDVGLARVLLSAGSDLVLFLAPEILGEKKRINTPGSVGAHNWVYRLPKTIAELTRDADVCAHMSELEALNVLHGR